VWGGGKSLVPRALLMVMCAGADADLLAFNPLLSSSLPHPHPDTRRRAIGLRIKENKEVYEGEVRA
jgi:hypothetical protein